MSDKYLNDYLRPAGKTVLVELGAEGGGESVPKYDCRE
jgi:hypothetical protein